MISQLESQKWYSNFSLKIKGEFELKGIRLIDFGVDLNCGRERLIPTKYFEKTI